MTIRSILSALVVLGLAFAAPAAADPALGIWRTSPDDNGNSGHVRIAPCGDRICGTLIRAFDGAGQQVSSDNIGRAIVWDMVPRGGGQYRDGKVWAPDRNRTYNARMQLQGDVLDVSGCVLGICRATRWQRQQ
ncbi:MAG: DUF2147 domain-containing protein [Gemmobacter sp.]